MQICVSLFTLMAGIFIRPELVAEPGLEQIGAALLIGTATIGITFSLQATYSENRVVDVAVRLLLAASALVALLHPNDSVAAAACVPVLAIIGYTTPWFVVRSLRRSR